MINRKRTPQEGLSPEPADGMRATPRLMQNRMTQTKSCKGIAQSIRQSAGKRKGRRKLPKETRPAPMANFPVQEFLRLYKSIAPGPQANAIGPMRPSDPLEGRMHLGMHLASSLSVEDRYVEAEANRAIRQQGWPQSPGSGAQPSALRMIGRVSERRATSSKPASRKA